MSEQADFKYDVALSFRDEDASIAQALADELSQTCSVFLYSERQRELAGKDGQDEFSVVFREQARVCAVLYRNGWGDTKWTRVEETAIKDRAFESGWEFLTVIAVEPGSPKWLPKTKIWLGLERFGVKGAAAVIEARVREQGGVTTEETARSRAERLGRAAQVEAERDAFLNSERGVRAAKESIDEVRAHLEAEAAAMRTQSPPLDCAFDKHPYYDVFGLSTSRSALTFGWSVQYSNALRGSNLLIQEFDHAYRVGPHSSSRREPKKRETWHFTLDATGLPAWYQDRAPDRTFSAKAMAEHFLKRFLDRAHEKRRQDAAW